MTQAEAIFIRIAELDEAIELIEDEGEEVAIAVLKGRRTGLRSAQAVFAPPPAVAPPAPIGMPGLVEAITRIEAAARAAVRDSEQQLREQIERMLAEQAARRAPAPAADPRDQVASAEAAGPIAAPDAAADDLPPAEAQTLSGAIAELDRKVAAHREDMAAPLPAAPEPEGDAAQLEEAAAEEPPAFPVKWTAERKALLARLYPTWATGEAMAEAINALPGEPATPAQCKSMAGNMGLKRIGPNPALAAVQQTDASPAPEPQAAPAPPARPAAPAVARGPRSGADLPAEPKDKAEAVKLREAGMSGRAVAEEMGLPLSTVSNWAAEVRLKQRASQAAKASAA